MPTTVKLARPITVMGEGAPKEITEITFRDPTPGDIRKIGSPYRLFTEGKKGSTALRGETAVDQDRLFRFMAALSGLAEMEIERVDIAAYNAAADWLGDALNPGGGDSEDAAKN